ncbi:MAG: VanZ family protein [Chloroflexi bacterium]|nr:VanZ family protein [Chloroflexota bacterium]
MRRNLITGGALGWALLIFMLSSQPGSTFDEAENALDSIPAIDSLAHLFLYFVLAALVHAVLRMYLPRRKNLLMVDTVIFALLYGVSDEFHQSFVPGRSVSGTDLLADVLGAVLAVTLWLAFDRIRRHRRGREDADAGSS